MATYADWDKPARNLCLHSVRLRDEDRVDELTESLVAWIGDDSRPGHWYWDLRSAHWAVVMSDPNVAFECKMRWG